MMRRSVKLSILNPQYAFLKVDFQNPNLAHLELKVMNTSEELRKVSNTKTAYKIIPSNIYIKLIWMKEWFLLIPVDIYCITVVVITGFLS